MELNPFPYYFVITKIENMSNEKYKLAYLNKYSPKKTSKYIWDKHVHTLQYGIFFFFFRAFMSGQMIAIKKQPIIRLVDVGETWRRLFSKLILKVAGPEATMACQDDQLCAGPKAGIDGTIHKVQALWDKKLSTEEWGILLLDARSAFNEINRVGILWTVRHLWPSGAHFLLNFYCNWSSLVLQNGNETASILHSREGVTQGDPLIMISYGIRILPLIKNLKWETHDVTQPWYADNIRALGTFAKIETNFYLLPRQGLGQGYPPDPTKSVLIIRPDNIEAGKEFRERHGFRVCTGACYLGGYIGDNKYKHDWLRDRTLTWDNNINTISEITGNIPGYLRCTGTCNPIRKDISSTSHLGHRILACRVEEDDLRNIFTWEL